MMCVFIQSPRSYLVAHYNAAEVSGRGPGEWDLAIDGLSNRFRVFDRCGHGPGAWAALMPVDLDDNAARRIYDRFRVANPGLLRGI